MIGLKTVFSLIKKPRKLVKILGDKGFFNWMPDKPYLKLVYRCETGKKLDLNNPQTFNEKLQWIKLYDRKPEYSIYADKYEVRKHIAETIGEKYLIPLIGVYESVDEIPWDELPNRFVLKCTHGSGSNIICQDKNKLAINDAKKKLSKWMKKSWYWFGREWPYKNVKPRIVCEEFISDTVNTPDDYKVMCFNGEPKCIQVHKGRFSNHTTDYYNTDWNVMNFKTRTPTSCITQEKPIILSEMLEISKSLSKSIIHVRVDFYYVNNRIYFGELTFFDASGYDNYPDEYNNLLGNWINLPIQKNDKKQRNLLCNY